MALKIVVLLVAASVVRAQNQLCATQVKESFRFTIGSLHNATGHHIITADLTTGYPAGVDHNGTTLDVESAKSSCGDSETASLSAVAARLPDSVLQINSHRQPVPLGYEAVPGLGAYKVHAEKRTWIEAHDACLSEGAHLMVLNSEQEANLVPRLCALNKCDTVAWMGFHGFFKDRHFVTVTGQLLKNSGYLVWQSGNPQGHKEPCGCIYIVGGLCDGVCSVARPFICELSRDSEGK